MMLVHVSPTLFYGSTNAVLNSISMMQQIMKITNPLLLLILSYPSFATTKSTLIEKKLKERIGHAFYKATLAGR
jgi:hypothetical protein